MKTISVKVIESTSFEQHSRQIAGIAVKEQTCGPYNRDRNSHRSKLKKN